MGGKSEKGEVMAWSVANTKAFIEKIQVVRMSPSPLGSHNLSQTHLKLSNFQWKKHVDPERYPQMSITPVHNNKG